MLFCISQGQIFVAGLGSNLLVNISFKEVIKSKIVTKILIFNIQMR